MNRFALATLMSGFLVTAAPAQSDAEIAPPERITFSKPEYPEKLRKARVEGVCELEMTIDKDGVVDRVQPLRVSEGGEDFIDPAVEAVCRWRYKPATQSGRPVMVFLMAVIHFTLRAEEPGAEPPLMVRPSSTEPRPCPARPIMPAAPPSRPPDAMGSPPTIDLKSGGPGALVLGASLEEAESVLAGASSQRTAAGDLVLKAHTAGIEARLAPAPDGTMAVRSIRYVFEEGRDGFAACPYRTAAGLGKGKLCLGIAPVHGAASRRTDLPGEGRRLVSTLEYDLDGARAFFTCVDRWLAELLIETAAPSAP